MDIMNMAKNEFMMYTYIHYYLMCFLNYLYKFQNFYVEYSFGTVGNSWFRKFGSWKAKDLDIFGKLIAEYLNSFNVDSWVELQWMYINTIKWSKP